MNDFDIIIAYFRSKTLKIEDYNFCYCINNEFEMNTMNRNKYSAYIMGTGAEDCLTKFHGFQTLEQLKGFYRTLGVQDKDVFQIG